MVRFVQTALLGVLVAKEPVVVRAVPSISPPQVSPEAVLSRQTEAMQVAQITDPVAVVVSRSTTPPAQRLR
jgi:hypothetical protein